MADETPTTPPAEPAAEEQKTVTVTLLVPMSAGEFGYSGTAGDQLEVPADVAARWVEAGIATARRRAERARAHRAAPDRRRDRAAVVTTGGPIALPAAAGALVWVAATRTFSAADLGDARVVPLVIPDGLGLRAGDRVEVTAAVAARWIAAGVAVATP